VSEPKSVAYLSFVDDFEWVSLPWAPRSKDSKALIRADEEAKAWESARDILAAAGVNRVRPLWTVEDVRAYCEERAAALRKLDE